ncbi:MAG: DNA mismatch repair endonuclease MutL [Planctomycetaceae bacterium]|jgi:DNA mismatch repair protein MutL
MPRIQQLDHHVVNKIAAGEVIERPASVLKELLENSIDALATRVEIDVAAGGTELLRIVDNGEGIHPDDLPLAIATHATSKLRTADDLFHVQTMGFRGEALASIAEVSRFRLRSRQEAFPTGSEITVDAGEVGPIVPVGCPVGTTIEVRDLFCNLPVRRKFLRQAATEFGHVSEQFTRIALANPRVHLVLRHNERTVYELPATENLLERIERFFGEELARALIPVEAEFRGSRLWGFIGHPSESRSTRKGQYLFLNGRWIQDRSLQHALTEAYRGLLMVGRNPITFLFLETPPETVDVNVHPTKAEVRFRDSQTLYRLVLSTIRNRFLGMDLNSSLAVGGGGVKLEPIKPRTLDPQQQQEAARNLVDWVKQQTTLWQQPGGPPPSDLPLPEIGGSPEAAASGANPPGAPRSEDLTAPDPVRRADFAGGDFAAGPATSSRDSTAGWGQSARSSSSPSNWSSGGRGGSSWPSPAELSRPFRETDTDTSPETLPPDPSAHPETGTEPVAGSDASTSLTGPAAGELVTGREPVENGTSEGPVASDAAAAETFRRQAPQLPDQVRAMQVHDSYLVLETGDGLTLIDQHALHERILYEHLRKRVLAGGVESQKLLVPLPVELPPAQAAALLEHLDLLASFGLKLQDFGGNTLLVTSFPVMLRRLDPAVLLKDLSEQILETGRDPSRRDMLDSLLHMMSCKGAVKAGQRLTPDEIDSLLAQRHLIDDAHHCPHGRPTALTLSRAELDRQFGRLG